MVKKVKKEDIKDCGSTIDGLHNMCFFLCLYNALGYNQKDEKNKKIFYNKCRVVAKQLPKTGEMIDTVRDSNAIRILAQHFNVYIRIYPTLHTFMSEYISDNPVLFEHFQMHQPREASVLRGHSGTKTINIIHVGNHYMLLDIDPDRLKTIPEQETSELVNKARRYQTSFIEQMDKDTELARLLQEEYIQEQKDDVLAKQLQAREKLKHKKYLEEICIQKQKDDALAKQLQAREELKHKKYLEKIYYQEKKDAELARELSV
jgi:hypothetical protein